MVKETFFKGLELHLAECKHNENEFEDVCIIKGWPLDEINNDETL